MCRVIDKCGRGADGERNIGRERKILLPMHTCDFAGQWKAREEKY